MKSALENLVIVERKSSMRVGWPDAVKTVHGRGGRRHLGDGRSSR
jgi:hypothetical protein